MKAIGRPWHCNHRISPVTTTLSKAKNTKIWGFPKIWGLNTPKMDGENNGKPYEQMDDLGVPLFLETPISSNCQAIQFFEAMVGESIHADPYHHGVVSVLKSWYHSFPQCQGTFVHHDHSHSQTSLHIWQSQSHQQEGVLRGQNLNKI